VGIHKDLTLLTKNVNRAMPKQDRKNWQRTAYIQKGLSMLTKYVKLATFKTITKAKELIKK
jgi:hypothetical protein